MKVYYFVLGKNETGVEIDQKKVYLSSLAEVIKILWKS